MQGFSNISKVMSFRMTHEEIEELERLCEQLSTDKTTFFRRWVIDHGFTVTQKELQRQQVRAS